MWYSADYLLQVDTRRKDSGYCFFLSAIKISGSIDSSEQKKTKTKLKKFLTRRPTLQAVREKGYIKGNGTFDFVTILLQIVKLIIKSDVFSGNGEDAVGVFFKERSCIRIHTAGRALVFSM